MQIHDIKRSLLLRRITVTNLHSVLKSRNIALLTKVHMVKAMVFPVIMYGCESWTIKKAEHWRIDAFELWCWRRLLTVPGQRGDQTSQSWIFIGRTDAEAETRILWSPDAKSWLIGKDPDAEKDWRQEEKGTTGWDGWMASPTRWTWIWASSGSWWWTGKPGVAAIHGVAKNQTWLSDWTTTVCASYTIKQLLTLTFIATLQERCFYSHYHFRAEETTKNNLPQVTVPEEGVLAFKPQLSPNPMTAYTLSLYPFFFFLSHTAQLVGSWFPDQEVNLHPGQGKHRILTTGPQRNSLPRYFWCFPSLLR